MFPRSLQHRELRLHKNLLITISAKKRTRKRKEVHDITAVQKSSNTCDLSSGFKISGEGEVGCHGGRQRGIKYNIKVGWRKGHYHFSSSNNTFVPSKPHQYFHSSQPWRNMGLKTCTPKTRSYWCPCIFLINFSCLALLSSLWLYANMTISVQIDSMLPDLSLYNQPITLKPRYNKGLLYLKISYKDLFSTLLLCKNIFHLLRHSRYFVMSAFIISRFQCIAWLQIQSSSKTCFLA